MPLIKSALTRFGSYRFRFEPVRFICGSVPEQFVVERFGSVLARVRFVSVCFLTVPCGSLRFVAVHCGPCGSWRFVSAAGSFRFGSLSVRFIPVRFVRFVESLAVRLGSYRFGSVHAVRFGSAAILKMIFSTSVWRVLWGHDKIRFDTCFQVVSMAVMTIFESVPCGCF